MNTMPFASGALMLAGVLTFIASLAHVACIVIGAPAYRIMGAGERMAQAAAAGHLRPTIMTLAIAAVLSAWAAYAFSGAGTLRSLPLTKWVLIAIALVFLARGLAFPWLKPMFPGNSSTFWWVSSGICLSLGGLYLYGLIGRWSSL